MKIPFILGLAIAALVIYGGLVGLNYLNFGEIDLILPTAGIIGGVWVGLSAVSLIVSWFIKESHKKTEGMSIDPERDFGDPNNNS